MGYSGVLLNSFALCSPELESQDVPSLLSQSHSKLRQPSTPLLPAPSRPHRLRKVNGVDDFTLGWVMLGQCLSRDTLDITGYIQWQHGGSSNFDFIKLHNYKIVSTYYNYKSWWRLDLWNRHQRSPLQLHPQTPGFLPAVGNLTTHPFKGWRRQVMRSWSRMSRMSRMSRAAVHIPSSFTTSQKQLNELDEVSISSFSIVSLNRIMGARWCQHGIEQYILFLYFFVPFEILLACSCISSNCLPPTSWMVLDWPTWLDHIGSTSQLNQDHHASLWLPELSKLLTCQLQSAIGIPPKPGQIYPNPDWNIFCDL